MKLFAILAIVGALLCGSCADNPVSPEVDQYILNPKDRSTHDRFEPLYVILLPPQPYSPKYPTDHYKLTDSGIVWVERDR